MLVETVAGLSALSAGGLLVTRGLARPVGWLLLVAALALPATEIVIPSTALPFTYSLLAAGLTPALSAVAGAAWPVVPLRRSALIVVGAALASAVVVGALLPALLLDPSTGGCNTCPANLVLLVGWNGGADRLQRTASGLTLLWGPALVALAGVQAVRAPALSRRLCWPMLTAGAGIALLATIEAGHALRLPTGEVDDFADRVWLVQCVLIVLLAAGIAWRAYLIRTAGRRMTRRVLAAVPDLPALLDSLRQAVSDPGLQIWFRRHDGRAIDADGEPVPDRPGRAVLQLSRLGVPFADLRYDPQLRGSADLLATAATSAGLALEYLAAQARLRAEVHDVIAVRTRLVAEGDARRRVLERNLHDGAQQRLVALGLMLASAGGPSRAFTPEHAEIDAALGELRAVARGLFPASLEEAGIGSALRELGDHTGVPLMVHGSIEGRLSRAAAMAVYQLVLDVTRRAPAPVSVELGGGTPDPARVRVSLDIPGSSSSVDAGTAVAGRGNMPAPASRLWDAVQPAEDRFVAAGGRLTLTSSPTRISLEGELPCAS